jgi:hypothetical protein
MTDENTEFSPSEFMKARHPDLFPDTESIDELVVDKHQLEFYLDTLTQRKEEIRFEHFCRRLAEKELCPNLLPQTGPTGGGDSKVDSETYPVSETIATRWYVGNPERYAKERWAFAFSAKKQWRPKVKDDVKKIVGTNRGYSLIYFMTNQAVRDKDRATIEDELHKKHGIPVRILDRSWITEKTITNKRWDIIFHTLEIQDPRTTHKSTPGPFDAQRTRDLKILEKQIEDPARYQNNEYQLAEDSLQTALLARGLGHPRTEIEGRFARAESTARKRNDNRQLFKILYNKAWTAIMWFDDYDELKHHYKTAEPLVINEGCVWDLEKLATLVTAGLTGQYRGRTDDWKTHAERLRAALLTLSTNTTMPTSALWARTQLVLMDLTDTRGKPEKLTPVLKQLTGVLTEAEGHLDYPADQIITLVQDLGDWLPDDETYKQLIEEAIKLRTKRLSKAEQGRMRLRIGLQKLNAKRYYTATNQLARAQTLLARDEDKDDFLRALAGTALAYEATGLIWAARATLVIALDRALYEFYKDGEIHPQTLPLLRKLIWIELQLGRAPCLFPWLDLLSVISHSLELPDDAREQLENECRQFDLVLGILILKTRFEDWPLLGTVVDLLERYSVLMSRAAALFALGHEDTFRSEYGQPEGDLQQDFSRWIQQPAAHDLPEEAEWHVGTTATLRTTIMGCKIAVVAETKNASLLLAETLLGFAESFLATTIMLEGHYSGRTNLEILIEQSPNSSAPFCSRIEEDDCGETRLIVTHTATAPATLVQDARYHEALIEFLASLIAQLHIPFSTETLEGLFANDRALDRAYAAAQSPLSVSNLLGEDIRYQIKENSTDKNYALLRDTPWEPDLTPSDSATTPPTFADGPPPSDVFDPEQCKHSDIQILSLINLPLWDKARWCGLGFSFLPGDSPMPGLFLLFKDLEAGTKIFRGWKKRLGDTDQDEQISVALITGIDREHPAHYRLAIGISDEHLKRSMKQKAMSLSVYRMQDMTPENSTNLDRFLGAYKQAGRYRLTTGTPSQLMGHNTGELSIEKTQLRITPAWQISPNDPLVAALNGLSKPIIPADVSDPPIRKAWAQHARLREKE